LSTLILAVAAVAAEPASQPASRPGAISAREGVPVIDWSDAGRFMDQWVVVQGRVVYTRMAGSMCILEFSRSRRDRFSAVINEYCYEKLPERPDLAFRGKNVRIFGMISEYRGRPEISFCLPDQIEVLDELPALPPAAPASQPALKETGPIKLAAYNVLNLFDDQDDPYRHDEGTPPKPRAELELLARTIRRLDADVLALEEVENRGYLEWFVRALLPDMGYCEIVHLESNDTRGIDCAVLSRFPVGPVTSYRHLKFKDAGGKTMRFERDLLRVSIEPPNRPGFDLFVVHLKSKGSGPTSDVIRIGEAGEIRRILDHILAQTPTARFAICGDFNDTWDSRSLQIIRGSGPTMLKHFFEELAPEALITYSKEPYRSMIDYILVSPSMAEDYVAGSFGILDGTVETSGSDHNPVFAEFDLKVER